MQRKKKTERRISFIEEIIKIMEGHEYLGKEEKRNGISENEIQRAVFSKLNKHLPTELRKIYNLTEKTAKKMVHTNFVYERKKKVSVNNFTFFATNHRPDAILSTRDLRIAFEIKKGDSGLAVRSGIGQSVVYASQFDFCIYFFVDTTPGRDIKNSVKSEREKKLIETLWAHHNIIFSVV